MDEYILFTGNANPALASSVAAELGVSLGDCTIQRFPDGEISIQLNVSVRRKEVFIIQPTSPPVNDHLIELLALADACRRAAAKRITAVIPYFGYARADRRSRREPITASMVASLIHTVGINHVITLDLHVPQIEGYFQLPVDNLSAVPVLSHTLKQVLADDVIVVSPDTGRVSMATDYAERLAASVAILHKRRENGLETEVTHLVGDVKNRSCLIIDDMIATGSTIANSVEALLEAGARPDIAVAATHGLFIGHAANKLMTQGVRQIFVTDSVATSCRDHVQSVSIAPMLASTIRRLLIGESLSVLY